jgi:hypothetical protein
MGNIFSDITDDISIKPSKSKLVIKWTFRIAIFLVSIAFTYGQYRMFKANKMAEMEKTLQDNTKAIVDLKRETTDGFKAVNLRIDKVYDDGLKVFNDFDTYNRKQLGLIIDFGATNKSLLKQMLEVNSLEKSRTIENQVEQAKILPPVVTAKDSISIIVQPVVPKK